VFSLIIVLLILAAVITVGFVPMTFTISCNETYATLTQIGDTTTQMMIFTTERYRVVIFTRCPSTSSKVEWDEIWAIGEKIEDNIK
jgi:hypothetical protein